MVIFNSYVSLPEGTTIHWIGLGEIKHIFDGRIWYTSKFQPVFGVHFPFHQSIEQCQKLVAPAAWSQS